MRYGYDVGLGSGDLFGWLAPQDAGSRAPASMDAADHPLYSERTVAMVDDDIVVEALAADAGSRRVLAKGRSPVAGQVVGVRLHLLLA